MPNGFGCGLGAVQLILYAIYRDNKGEKGNKTPEGNSTKGIVDGDSIELGFPDKPPPPHHQEEDQANKKDKHPHTLKPANDHV